MFTLKKLDKLIKQAKQVQRKKDFQAVHIIEGGYCSACKGRCKYEDSPENQLEDGAVIFYEDWPEDDDVVVINIDIPRQGEEMDG